MIVQLFDHVAVFKLALDSLQPHSKSLERQSAEGSWLGGSITYDTARQENQGAGCVKEHNRIRWDDVDEKGNQTEYGGDKAKDTSEDTVLRRYRWLASALNVHQIGTQSQNHNGEKNLGHRGQSQSRAFIETLAVL